MIRTLLSLLLIGVSAPALVAQQPALVVETNRAIAYDARIEISSTQNILGQEVAMRLAGTGTTELMPRKVGAKQIEWSVGFPSLALRIESPMLANGTVDTTLRIGPDPMITDRAGRIVAAPKVDAGNAQRNLLLQQGLGTMWWSQFFSPAVADGRRVGERWELRADDTVGDASLGLSMHRAYMTQYAVEALVDTLGVTTARVRVAIPSITVNGDLSMQGMPMSLSGDGVASGVHYYDVRTGMLVAGTLDSELNLTAALTGGAKMIVPVTFVTSYSIVRTTGQK
jgi:hypothetical protein